MTAPQTLIAGDLVQKEGVSLTERAACLAAFAFPAWSSLFRGWEIVPDSGKSVSHQEGAASLPY